MSAKVKIDFAWLSGRIQIVIYAEDAQTITIGSVPAENWDRRV